MNSRGVYTPDQINEQCEKWWAQINTEETTFVKKDKCQLMVEGAVNTLGKIGDGQTFDEALF